MNRIIFTFIFILTSSKSFAFLGSNENFLEFKALGGFNLFYTELKTEAEEEYQNRRNYVYGLDASVGMRVSFMYVGYGIDYSIWNQTKDASNYNNTNTNGTMIGHSLVLGTGTRNIGLLLKWYLSSEYEYSKANQDGGKVSLEEVEGSYNIQLIYKISPISYIGLQYINVEYEKASISGTSSVLSNTLKPRLSGYGLVYGFSF